MSYQQLNDQGRSVGLEVDAAEGHGIFCGLLSGGSKDPEGIWLGELLAELDPQDLLVVECVEALRNLARGTREEIEGPEMGFSLLLPGDGEALSVRANALRDWCRGFLYGMGLSGTGEGQLSADTLEAVNDMIDISRLDVELVSSSEQDEEAYAELCEFVRVAAMLVYEERANKGETKQ